MVTSAAEIFGLVTSALHHYFRESALPDAVEFKFYGGPPRSVEPARPNEPVSVDVLAHVVADVADYLSFYKRVPAEAWRGNYPISTGDFMATISRALVTLYRKGKLPTSIEIAKGNVTCMRYVPEKASVSTWPSFPPNFADHNGVALAYLQCWTLKPAVRG